MSDPIAVLHAALQRDPGASALHKNLAVELWRAGRLAEAREVLSRAAQLFPGDASIWARLARVQVDMGDAAGSLASLKRAEVLLPAKASTWLTIGSLHAESGRWADGDRALSRAAQLEPGGAEVELRLAQARQEMGDAPRALEGLARALARNPEDLNVAVAARLTLPQVYSSLEELGAWRARYTRGLEELAANVGRWKPHAAQALELNHHNFLLAYQGGDDRALQALYSRFIGELALHARPDWREARAPDFDGGRRLRVGFVGNIFRDCTAGRYFERWITGLDAARFERFVYHTAPVSDAFTRRIAQGSEHFASTRQGNVEVAARIAADRLDVLVQPEVGMTPLSYLLAAVRLAPVQVAGWGHPVTTGGLGVDAYFTAGAMEPADAQAHYAERLVPLPGLGVDYALPELTAPLGRDALKLPEGKRLYICPQSLFKVHPAMDALVADIAARDDDALLLFFQAPAHAVTEQFAARLQRAFAARGVPARGQVKFLPRMAPATFRRALAAADVMIDTLHWSGGNTSLDALAAGLPIVTLPGRFMRGRQSAAMLQMLGLPELIAADAESYVRTAIEVARDGERNRALRRAIVERRGAIFGRPEPVAAFAEALLAMGSGRRP